jgi:hypothetical protein
MTVTRRVLHNLMALVLFLVLAGLAGAAQSPEPPKPSQTPVSAPETAAEPAPKVAPKAANVPVSPHALQILNRACEVLSSAKAFTYHAEINFDSVLPSDVKLQFAAEMDVALQRPDHLAISYASDLGAKRVWYDGKSVTVVDPAHMTYATAAAPDTIDGMFEQFAKEKNVSIPLEGFDFSHPCQRIRANLIHGTYVGVGDVDGVDCDHLAFLQKSAAWQIWIDHEKHPMARKIVITYNALPMAPQYSAVLSHWNLEPKFPAGFFKPQIPKKAMRIKFMELKEKHK